MTNLIILAMWFYWKILQNSKNWKTPQKQVKNSFQNILTDAVKEADQAVKDTREMDVKLAAGQIDNLHTALIQAEQSAAAIEFTTQLTSKAVSAYTQIMGMQI